MGMPYPSTSSNHDILTEIYYRLYNINASLNHQQTISMSIPIFNPNDIESYIYQQINALGNTLASGSGGSSAIAWTSVTSSFTASLGQYIAANSVSGTFPILIPASVGSLKEIDFIDPQGSWATNNVTVVGNINGNGNLVLNISGGTTKIVDVGGTTNWRSV